VSLIKLLLSGQVQFLNVVGKVGGSNGSASLSTFSGGFGWANLDLPGYESVFPWRTKSTTSAATANVSAPPRRSGTTSKYSSSSATDGKGCSGLSSCAEEEACDWASLFPSLERLSTCIALLFAVFFMRTTLALVLKYAIKMDPPEAFLFPSWEGPVLVILYSIYVYVCKFHIWLVLVSLSEYEIYHAI
jgi:hypothetical protein